MVFIRRVRTKSGATAVQVAEYSRGRQRIIKHIGSAHTEAELGVLLAQARGWIDDGQQTLDIDIGFAEMPTQSLVEENGGQAALLDPEPPVAGRAPAGRVAATPAGILRDVLTAAYRQLGFDRVDDAVFCDLVVARIVEPTSKRDAPRVLRDLGFDTVSYATIKRSLGRIQEQDYRDQIAKACFAYSAATTGLSLLLYDVTTLYFEAEKEDSYRKVGYSKERRVDPQIVIGLLVDRTGFPLEIRSFEGNKAETHTMIPVIKAFQDRHNVADMVVVADAGMLSAKNLQNLDDAGLRFIVGSRQTKAPQDLAKYFHWHGTHHEDGLTVDTITMRRSAPDPDQVPRRAEPVWDPETDTDKWRAVWQYRRKRALRDQATLNQQRNRAIAIIDGERAPKKARFVREKGGKKELDEASYARAIQLVGWKGYSSNIPASIMPAAEVVSSYHDLWHVEQSFRMSKTDLAARPIFHRVRESIEAHLTVVFAALAVSRYVQTRTGLAIGNIVKRLRPLRSATIEINGTQQTFPPHIPAQEKAIIDAIMNGKLTH